MNKTNILITIKKELRSIFRDRKTIFMILGFPFIIALFIFLMGGMEDSLMGSTGSKYRVGLNYELNSTEKEIISELSLTPSKYNSLEELEEAFKNSKIDCFIYYDKEKSVYTLYSDNSMSSTQALSYATTYLDSYNKYLGDQYIKGEDIDPEVVYGSINYEVKDISGEEMDPNSFIIKMVMDMAFTYIIAAIAIATVNMATTAIATEKENGTLETILTFPITVSELIVGKYLATVIIGAISSIIGYAITIGSFTIAKGMFSIYEGFTIDVSAIILGIAICIFASFLIAAIAIAITSNAKSYKEAQAAGQILQIFAVAPMLLSFVNITKNVTFYLIPILNHANILMDLYSSNVNYLFILETIISTIIYTIIIIFFVIKKFKSEKVLFSTN